MTKLTVEPYGNHYCIVIKGSNEISRPILYSSNLPLATMEEICKIMEDRYRQVYKEGWAEGYKEGWNDCAGDDVNK